MDLTTACVCGRNLDLDQRRGAWNTTHSIVEMVPGRVTVVQRCPDCGEMAPPVDVDPLPIVDWLLSVSRPSEHRDGFALLGVVTCPACSRRFGPGAYGPDLHPDWRAQLESWQTASGVTFLRFRCPHCTEGWVTWGPGQEKCSPERMASAFLDALLTVFPTTRAVGADGQPVRRAHTPGGDSGDSVAARRAGEALQRLDEERRSEGRGELEW